MKKILLSEASRRDTRMVRGDGPLTMAMTTRAVSCAVGPHYHGRVIMRLVRLTISRSLSLISPRKIGDWQLFSRSTEESQAEYPTSDFSPTPTNN